MLCKELGLAPERAPAKAGRRKQEGDLWEALPYGRDGLPSDGASTTLNLSQGQRIALTDGNAPLVEPGTEGVVGPKTKQGHYTLLLDGGKRCTLGKWMLCDAKAGKLARLPLVNAPRRKPA
uniref:Uncharacterized protein n=1 Tax=Prymnesium polylepis TaxID=72548 RepID=A0A7S4NKS7_9EUKA